ncbi:MAG TPA: nucleotide pyrophosphohydrolase [Terriglobales bacterium]|nr:nucleotide pyrophosphohydrolase [Terriglobales bacterium]
MTTSDTSTTLAQLKDATAQFARARDWEQFHAPKNLSMAIAAETAELMEHFLWVSAEDSIQLCEDAKKRPAISEELADIVILTLQFANMTGVDISSAVRAKIAKNDAKYPVSKAKGRSTKYTEL